MILRWLRRAILGDAVTIAGQSRVLFRATLRAVLVGLAASLLLVMGAFGGWASFFMMSLAILALVTALALGAVAWLTYATLHDGVLGPLDEVATVSRRIAGGDLQAAGEPHGAPEFQQITSTLALLAGALLNERNHRAADRRQGEKENTSLREILTITREVGSHLEQEPIIATLAAGARRLGGYTEVIIWRLDELDSHLVRVYPTEGTPTKVPARVRVDTAAAGRAASSGQTVQLRAEGPHPPGLAVPLAVGGAGLRILGVLELRGENVGEAIVANPIDALEALAAHAATALAAAQLYEQLEMRSETDGLTKVFNRRRFDSDLRSEVVRSLRYGHPLTLIMVDVDHFKSINDTFGHQTGDEVLKVVAATIGQGRETDAAYRFGGEEFAVLLRETDMTAARAVAERMRIKIKENVAGLHLPRDVTASLGVASISDAVQTPEKLVEAADSALYHAKETGRNRVVVNRTGRLTGEAAAG